MIQHEYQPARRTRTSTMRNCNSCWMAAGGGWAIHGLCVWWCCGGVVVFRGVLRFKKGFWVCGSGGVFESCTFYLHDGRANRGCRLSCTVRTPSLGHVEARGRIETPGEHTLDAQLRIQLHLRKIQQPRLPRPWSESAVAACCCRVLLLTSNV